MPAKSVAQRRLFALALQYKRGKIEDVSDEVKDLAEMPEEKLKDYAGTPEEGLPDKVEENTKVLNYDDFIHLYEMEATPVNTPGMGNVTPGEVGEVGSSDKFSSSYADWLEKKRKDEEEDEDE